MQSLPEARADGVWMRVIAGQAYGLRSPVRTHTPLFDVHAVMPAGSRIDLPVGHAERTVYIVSGSLEFGAIACPDWQAGRIALPPNDRSELIPLP